MWTQSQREGNDHQSNDIMQVQRNTNPIPLLREWYTQ